MPQRLWPAASGALDRCLLPRLESADGDVGQMVEQVIASFSPNADVPASYAAVLWLWS